jgi:hypothetical protein
MGWAKVQRAVEQLDLSGQSGTLVRKGFSSIGTEGYWVY